MVVGLPLAKNSKPHPSNIRAITKIAETKDPQSIIASALSVQLPAAAVLILAFAIMSITRLSNSMDTKTPHKKDKAAGKLKRKVIIKKATRASPAATM
jgi:hypothetical protein